jgi:hypothetical protein
MSGETKISDYTIIVIFVSQDDVFRFKIPVHDPFFMHVFKSLKQPLHHCLDLGRRELVLGLDLVVELTALQKFNLSIDRVLGLVNSVKPHKVFVIEFSVELNFVYEGFLTIFLLIGPLFGKGLDGIFSLVLVLNYKVDRGKISFSYLFYRLKKLMKTSLIDSWLK